MIIDRGDVDNYFRRVNILTITLSGIYYLFYYTEITIRQETLHECCWWGRCGFLGEKRKKSFAKMCGSILLRKRVPTLDGFIRKQRSYRHFNATKYVFQCRHCNKTSERFNSYVHQCCACDSRNYRRVLVRIFTLRPMEVLHGKFMWGIIK